MKSFVSVVLASGLWLAANLFVATPSQAEEWTETRLYFGNQIPIENLPCNGNISLVEVTDSLWRVFLAKTVVPLFDGFTVLEAVGYWKGAPEVTRILVISNKGKVPPNIKTSGIADIYRSNFCQEAVLRTVTVVDGQLLSKL